MAIAVVLVLVTIVRYIRNNNKPEYIPPNEWIVVSSISPVSSLDTVIQGVNQALDRLVMETGGLLDLRAEYTTEMQQAGLRIRPLIGGRHLARHDLPSVRNGARFASAADTGEVIEATALRYWRIDLRPLIAAARAARL